MSNDITTEEFVHPGPIGRALRLFLGTGLLTSLLLTPPVERINPDGLFWVLAVYAVWSCASLVNIGFDCALGNLPRVGFLLVVGASMSADVALYHRLWAPPGAWTVYLGLLIVVGAQGVSYVLAALLATPGCEWRALSHLIARLRNKEWERARACPVGLHRLDEWEYRRKQARTSDQL